MRGTERRLAILQIMRESGHADSSDLAERFGVSTMTIRRDLLKLQDEGLVTTEYGGAVLNEGTLYEHDMYTKQLERQAQKVRIAQRCAEFVHEGDAIFLDAGSTVLELARILARRTDISVMTHSLLVANAFASSQADITVCPGKYRPMSMAYMGQLTSDFVRDFRFDKVFLSVEGLDLELGASVPDVTDGFTKRAFISSSERVCCMADSSKFDARYHCSICGWDRINLLVTDNELEDEKLRRYSEVVSLVTV